MTDEQRQTIMAAFAALNDARRLWPQKHPASGMIVGIDEDCRQTYAAITSARDRLAEVFLSQSADLGAEQEGERHE